MYAKDIVIGEIYEHVNPDMKKFWYQATKILKPRTGVNKTNRIYVECLQSMDKHFFISMRRHVSPRDLVELEVQGDKG